MQACHWLAFHCEENKNKTWEQISLFNLLLLCVRVCVLDIYEEERSDRSESCSSRPLPASSSHAAVDEWASSSCQVVEQKRTSLIFPSLFSNFWSWAQIPTNWSDKTSDSVNHCWFIQPELKASSVWINLHKLNWSLHFFDFLIRQTVLQILPSDALYQHHSALVY